MISKTGSIKGKYIKIINKLKSGSINKAEK